MGVSTLPYNKQHIDRKTKHKKSPQLNRNHQKSPEITRNHQKSPAISMPKGSGLTKPLKLSAELKKLLASEEDEMSRPQVVKALWLTSKLTNFRTPTTSSTSPPTRPWKESLELRRFGLSEWPSF